MSVNKSIGERGGPPSSVSSIRRREDFESESGLQEDAHERAFCQIAELPEASELLFIHPQLLPYEGAYLARSVTEHSVQT